MSYDCRNHGYLLPVLRNQLVDLLPEIQGSPTDRVVRLQRDESLDIAKFYPEDSAALPKLTLVTSWPQIPQGTAALEMTCLLLTESVDMVDVITSAKAESTCGGVVRAATENESGQIIEDTIQIVLEKVDSTVTFIAFYACPRPSGDGVFATSVTGHTVPHEVVYASVLCDLESKREIGSLPSKHLPPCESTDPLLPSCLVGLLFKLNGKWFFQNASRRAPSATVQENIQHFKQYATTEKRVLITRTQVDSKMESNVKRYANK